MVNSPTKKRRLGVRAHVRAAMVYARLPFVTRKLPKPVFEQKRSRFDAEAYFLEIWKLASGRKKIENNSFLAMDAFSTYIRKVDDLLDVVGHPDFSTNKLFYKKDPFARKTISGFVRMIKEAKLLPEEKRDIFRATIAYRKKVTAVVERFERAQNPSFDDVRLMREQTTGEMGRVLAKIMNMAEHYRFGKAQQVENSFFNFFMGLQVMDDMADIQEDVQNHTVNLALPILKKYPTELERILHQPKSGVTVFRKNCPRAYGELMALGQEYLERLPTDKSGERALVALFRVTFGILDWLPSKTRR